jgi:short-subunit dehydrogenase
MSSFAQRYGPWAVIAGASEGIGAAFAHALARRGTNVVLVARRPEPLEALALELRGAGIEVRTLPLDLATPALEAGVARVTAELDVGLLVCSAAVSLIGPLDEIESADLQRTLDVNVRAPVVLCRHFAPRLLERGRGGIVLMSSVAGLTAAPFTATYAGSKAFALAFGESLWGELAPGGVDVLTCLAGPTRTPTYTAVQTSRFPAPMEADAVVESALHALGRKTRVVPGWINRLTAALVPRLPRRLGIRLIASQTRKYSRRLK